MAMKGTDFSIRVLIVMAMKGTDFSIRILIVMAMKGTDFTIRALIAMAMQPRLKWSGRFSGSASKWTGTAPVHPE